MRTISVPRIVPRDAMPIQSSVKKTTDVSPAPSPAPREISKTHWIHADGHFSCGMSARTSSHPRRIAGRIAIMASPSCRGRRHCQILSERVSGFCAGGREVSRLREIADGPIVFGGVRIRRHQPSRSQRVTRVEQRHVSTLIAQGHVADVSDETVGRKLGGDGGKTHLSPRDAVTVRHLGGEFRRALVGIERGDDCQRCDGDNSDQRAIQNELRTVHVLLIEPRLLVRHVDFFALDVEALDLGRGFQRVAVGDHQVGPLPFSMDPILSPAPQIWAALRVTALSASSSGSPKATAGRLVG